MKLTDKITQTRAPITAALEVMPRTHLVWLEAPEIAAAARPGQFFMVKCGEEGLFLPRPISIHRKDGGKIALLFQTVGKGTRWLAEQKPGRTLDIFGPLGNGFTIAPEARNLLLVAGGIGIAPLVFLADAALEQGKKVTILLGAAAAVNLFPVSHPPRAAGAAAGPIGGLHVLNATEDGSEGYRGRVTGLIPHYLDAGDQVFACGPAAMYRTMAAMPELKDKPVQVSLEVVMGCGAGVCYGCTIKTKKGLKQVCQDGPVFEMGDVIWEALANTMI
jgi:dihydroorotate dehydrogenase electron transfer subunit